MCDIDHFKSINDTLGHDAGDRILRLLGQTIRECVRASDVVCRYGGEEFIVILPKTDRGRVRLSLQRRFARKFPNGAIGRSDESGDRCRGQHRHFALSRPRRA